MAEYWRGEISLRKLRVLVEGLPPNGALARAAAGHALQYGDFRMADVVDLMGQLVTDFRNANRAEKSPPQPYPEAVWRPEPKSAVKKRKSKDRREATEARSGYLRIVAQVTPQYAEKG
ncbi:hypothetical protein [Streptomyces sp. ATCC 21386]|uniref:hypothetical protein n=1 Tax=Streptomyces sp. ATCC 21386 TaxID=2699428 RepID=UPI001BFF1F7C|nr:hypothetical protein [Streptomyces sp. ATCC 21386]